jgi:hypothetical protein
MLASIAYRSALAAGIGLSIIRADARAQASVAVPAGKKAAPTADSLAGITVRGRLLAEYDYAAWIASDSLMARRPDMTVARSYVARRVGDRWTVAFGRLGAAQDTFHVAYEVRQRPSDPERFDVEAVTPPRADTGFYLRASRALEIAKSDFGRHDRPYNAAVLERVGGGFWVYLMPAQVQDGVYPLGADVRYHVANDGRSIIAKRQLHNALLEFSGQSRDGSELKAGTHTAVLDDIPEDTDVFHVLVRKPSVPEYIPTQAFVYAIYPDGGIRLFGRTEDVLGEKGKSASPVKP